MLPKLTILASTTQVPLFNFHSFRNPYRGFQRLATIYFVVFSSRRLTICIDLLCGTEPTTYRFKDMCQHSSHIQPPLWPLSYQPPLRHASQEATLRLRKLFVGPLIQRMGVKPIVVALLFCVLTRHLAAVVCTCSLTRFHPSCYHQMNS